MSLHLLRGPAVGWAAALVCLSGCSLAERRDGAFEGRVAFGFEEASLTPCGGDESWWLGGGGASAELEARYTALGLGEYAPAYARVEGQISARGAYGHLGAYERRIEIEQVITVEPLDPARCP